MLRDHPLGRSPNFQLGRPPRSAGTSAIRMSRREAATKPAICEVLGPILQRLVRQVGAKYANRSLTRWRERSASPLLRRGGYSRPSAFGLQRRLQRTPRNPRCSGGSPRCTTSRAPQALEPGVREPRGEALTDLSDLGLFLEEASLVQREQERQRGQHDDDRDSEDDEHGGKRFARAGALLDGERLR
jgi:hypothetical protein